MSKPFVFQIVGYQNSGKTTFLNKLISYLSDEGFKTVTIKHHGHGGKPSIDEETDSALHIQAGAAASLVEGGGRMILQAENTKWLLNEKIELMSVMKPDFILVEGHKYENYPKVVFIRYNEDTHLLKELTNIQLVICKEPLNATESWQSFHRNDQNAINWLVEYLKSQLQK